MYFSVEEGPFKSCAPGWLGCSFDTEVCISCSYVLERNSSWCLCLHMLVPLWGLSFCCVYGFLCCAGAFKGSQVPFISFRFIFHDSKRWVKEKLAAFYVKVCSAFSLKRFILPVHLFRSLVYLEFISVYAVREYANFILMTISLKTCSVLHSGWDWFHRQCGRVPFFPHFLQNLLFVNFWTMVTVNYVRKYLT